MENKEIITVLETFILSVSAVFATDIKLNINNQYITTTVAPLQENGTTMVPIRFVRENLNCTVDWKNEIISITSADTTSQASGSYYQYKDKSYQIIEVDGGDRSGSRQKMLLWILDMGIEHIGPLQMNMDNLFTSWRMKLYFKMII